MTTMRADMAMLKALVNEHAPCQKGSVLVEFALILPVFLLFLFGVITFSVALYDKMVLTMATREGARAGTVYVANQTDDTIISRARYAASQSCLNIINFGTNTPDVPLPTIETLGTNRILTVTATVNFSGVYIFSDPLLISAQTSMRLE